MKIYERALMLIAGIMMCFPSIPLRLGGLLLAGFIYIVQKKAAKESPASLAAN